MDHIQDLISGGGNNINVVSDEISYYVDEARAQSRYKLTEGFSPVDVCPVESKIYDFLKNEGISISVSPVVQCEAFLITKSGYITVVMPYGAERKDQLDRLVGLAHEVGHYLDLKHNHKFNADDFYSGGDKVKERTKETLAWKYACDILMCYGFNYWEEFMRKMKRSLSSYFDEDEWMQADYYTNQVFEHMRNKCFH